MNYNVQKYFKAAIPKYIYDEIIKGKKIKDSKNFYLNCCIIITPKDYIDLIHLESASYFIMSDSGGIQEEAVVISKTYFNSP